MKSTNEETTYTRACNNGAFPHDPKYWQHTIKVSCSSIWSSHCRTAWHACQQYEGQRLWTSISTWYRFNNRAFGSVPAYAEMNLCNIHFHKNAEHKGGEFTKYAGNSDGQGYQSGYVFSGSLSTSELTQVNRIYALANMLASTPEIRSKFTMFTQPRRSTLAPDYRGRNDY